MALVVFRSRAASQIVMFADDANRLLELVGKTVAERGVIRAEEVDAALQALQRAVERERREEVPEPPPGEPPAALPVSLRQRAFPLIEMLRAAGKRRVDVTWGI